MSLETHSNESQMICLYCGGGASSACGKCGNAFYCGRHHQEKHWPKHKMQCHPFNIEQTESTGRYLVSSKQLPAGSLILKEAPFVIGPKATSTLVCLSCHNPIISNNFFKCLKCQWPMCSEKCAEHPQHREECKILSLDKKGCGIPNQHGETPRYDLILVLRCLLLKKIQSESWGHLQSLESHWVQRKEDAEPHHIAAVRYFTEVCKLDVEKDIVHQVRGAIITNAINTKSPSGITLRGLYSKISLLNHSCYPNVSLRSDKNHVLYIRTTVDVKKGEPLCFSYVPPTEPVWCRQHDLKDIYYFTCNCIRCNSPSEMNTFYSSLLCSECSKGFLIPCQNISVWKCNKCLKELKLKEIMKQSNDLLQWVNNKKLSVKYVKLFLKSIAEKCHKFSFIYFESLQLVLTFLKENTTAEADYTRKEIWQDIITILNVIEPGITRRKGVSLLELGVLLLDLYGKEKSKASKKRNSPITTEEIKSTLKEANAILSLEPPESTEENWKELAKKKFQEVEALL